RWIIASLSGIILCRYLTAGKTKVSIPNCSFPTVFPFLSPRLLRTLLPISSPRSTRMSDFHTIDEFVFVFFYVLASTSRPPREVVIPVFIPSRTRKEEMNNRLRNI
ncbi:hypothetical protein NGRA_3541, partial [Nosema granulosis]